MIRRLLLLLLLAAFAVPAAAAAPACHAETAPMHHSMPAAADKATPAHVCVGCVPLADRLGERVAFRIVPAGARPATPIVRLDLRHPAAPTLPPPRDA